MNGKRNKAIERGTVGDVGAHMQQRDVVNRQLSRVSLHLNIAGKLSSASIKQANRKPWYVKRGV